MLSRFLLLAGLALPAQILAAHVAHEMLESIPEGWLHVRDAASDERLSLHIELKHQNIDKMVESLYAVSTPGDAAYGKHWSREQVEALVAPSDEAVLATVGWLNASGISTVSTNSARSVEFTTTVGKANALLNTKFAHYKRDGVTKLRTTQYSVHENVARHVDLIHPTIYFGKTVANSVDLVGPLPIAAAGGPPVALKAVDANCSRYLSPNCIKQLYNIPVDYTPFNDAGASIAFGSFLNQSAQQDDQLLYEARFGIPSQAFDVITINGGIDNQSAPISDIGEANMDAQIIAGLTYPLPLREYITGGSPPFVPNLNQPAGQPTSNEPYLQYYKYLLARTNQELPQVITNSYGDDEQTVPKSYAIRVCNLIGMMGLRGITVLESSGDSGVGAVCRENTGKKRPQFTPSFPGTCPYITTVGGTQNIPEVAWVGSGGGFSNYFARPSYQETAVNTYLDKHVKSSVAIYYTPYTNFSGRGYPDISAMSVSPYYLVYYDGRAYGSGGTSAASPVVASVIALLNDARLKAGKSSLGFLNPWLYNGGYNAVRDITGGQAIGCNGVNTQTGLDVPGGGVIPYATWNATVGWDPATGWGVPNFQKMLKSVMRN